MDWKKTFPINLIRSGVRPEQRDSLNFRIQLTNVSTLFSWLATLAYLPTHFKINSPVLIVTGLLNSVNFIIPLVLNARGFNLASRSFLVILSAVNLTFFSCLYGKDSGYENFFIALEALILILYDHTERRHTVANLLVVFASFFFLVTYGYERFPPMQLDGDLAQFMSESFKYVTFASISLTVLGLSYSHKRIEKSLERTLSQVVRERDSKASLIANAPALIFVTDQNGRILTFNHACEQSIGLERIEAVGKSIQQLIPEITPASLSPLSHGGSSKLTYAVQKADGARRYLSLTSVPTIDPTTGENHLLWLGEDITESRASAELLKTQEQKLEAAGRLAAIGEVAASIAHEINNPLTVLRLQNERITQYLKDQSAPLPIQGASSRVDAMSLRITRIIRSLQSLTRNSDADPFVRVSLEHLLQDATDFVEDRYRTAGFELQLHSENLNTEIECRPIQISQVVLNLLTNAWDSIRERTQLEPECPRRVDIQCDRMTESGREWIRIHVIDTGKGLDPEAIAKIGKSIFSTKPPGRGTGIGLKLSHTILETHSGRLSVSIPNAPGTTQFTLVLPIQQLKHPA